MEPLSTLMTATSTTKMDGAPVLTLPKDVNGGGDGGTKEGADANGDATRERHSKVITLVIEKFIKLQKECRYRRYKVSRRVATRERYYVVVVVDAEPHVSTLVRSLRICPPRSRTFSAIWTLFATRSGPPRT